MTISEDLHTDEELVRQCLSGREQSFVLLMRRYQHLVFGLCRNILGNREDALDATQDAFITSFKRLGELRQRAEFRAWLRRIAVNACRQRLRSARSVANASIGEVWIDPYQGVDDTIDMNRALTCLSPDTRLTVLLFYFEGCSVRDISRFVGASETTVMSRLRNARSQLRREMKSMFEEPSNRSSLPEDFVERIPIPYDEYGPHREDLIYEPMSDWRREWLLSAYPPGTMVLSSELSGYDWELIPDRAVRAVVQTVDGDLEPVNLRMSGRKDAIQMEAALLPVLGDLGLPVPRVIAGPAIDPDFTDRGMLLATTPPVGQSALEWAVEGGTMAIDRACDAVLEGIEWIKSVTSGVESSPVSKSIERCSLADELHRVIEIGGPWMSDPRFAEAITRLRPIVEEIQLPLVFSDSGIGPNARVDADGNLIGFESFSWARFEDPHYQITKYWTYDCWPIRRAGFVERYLVRNGLSMKDFAPRLGVRALVTLQREIPTSGGDGQYRADMLGWLKLALDSL